MGRESWLIFVYIIKHLVEGKIEAELTSRLSSTWPAPEK
jgi:hypothetical protein